MNIKVKDLEPPFNVFTEIEKKYQYIETAEGSYTGLKIFTLMNGTTWDLLYRSKFSERITSTSFNTLDRVSLADIIYGAFHDKWNTACDNIDKYNKVGLKKSIETKEPSNFSNTITTTHEISPYNEDALVMDSKDTTINSGVSGEAYTKTTTVENSSSIPYNKMERMLSRNSIVDMVFKDVNELLTLSIFESEEL